MCFFFFQQVHIILYYYNKCVCVCFDNKHLYTHLEQQARSIWRCDNEILQLILHTMD